MSEYKQKIHSLELVRAIAALSVMIGHADYIPVYQGIKSQVTLWDGLPSLGVNLFFVLSGFVIFYVHGRHLSQPNEVKNYLWRRFVRIWPLYAVLTLVDAFLKPLLMGGDFPSVSKLAASLLFLEIHVQPILGVGWTLNHEAFFYLLFTLSLIFSKRLTLLALIVFSVLLVFRPFDISYENQLTSWIFSPYRWHFICGIIAAAWFGNGLDARSKIAARKFSVFSYVILSLFWLVGIFYLNENYSRIDFIKTPLMISLLIIFMVNVEKRYQIKIHRSIMYIGAISYSLYLTHSTILYAGIKIINKKQPQFTNGCIDQIMIILCVISLLLAIACHEFLEKPLMRIFKKNACLFNCK